MPVLSVQEVVGSLQPAVTPVPRGSDAIWHQDQHHSKQPAVPGSDPLRPSDPFHKPASLGPILLALTKNLPAPKSSVPPPTLAALTRLSLHSINVQYAWLPLADPRHMGCLSGCAAPLTLIVKPHEDLTSVNHLRYGPKDVSCSPAPSVTFQGGALFGPGAGNHHGFSETYNSQFRNVKDFWLHLNIY